jgi:anti-anti-sigma factor
MPADRAGQVEHRGLVFGIDTRRQGAAIHFAVSGELDIATGAALVEALRTARDSGAGLAVVDLEQVGFMDSEGLRALLAAKRMLHSHGFPVALVRASPAVRRIVELTGAQQLLPWDDDVVGGGTPPPARLSY